MAEKMEHLSQHLGNLLQSLSAAESRKLLLSIARKIRQSQSQRIGRQQNPDGSSYVPRIPRKNLRDKKGKIKRKMFMRLKQSKFIKIETTPQSIAIGFDNRLSRIARVHQEGQVENLKYNGRTFKVRYAQRILLGLTQTDIELVETDILNHFNKF